MSSNKKEYGEVMIYALATPDNNQVFYVGRSKTPAKRMKDHTREARNFLRDNIVIVDAQTLKAAIALERKKGDAKAFANLKKVQAIATLLLQELEPRLLILDRWDKARDTRDANRLEDAWIAEMTSRGHKLTNYIYSHRQQPNWYKPKSTKSWQKSWAQSPLDYIDMLKAGKIAQAKENKQWRKTRRKLRRQAWNSKHKLK